MLLRTSLNFVTQCPPYVIIQERLLGVSGPEITVFLNKWCAFCHKGSVTHMSAHVPHVGGSQGLSVCMLCTNPFLAIHFLPGLPPSNSSWNEVGILSSPFLSLPSGPEWSGEMADME